MPVVFVGLFLLTVVHAAQPTIHPAPTVPGVYAQPAKAVTTGPDITELWQLTNAERAKAGSAPLTLDERLNQSAADKCQAMVQTDQWVHILPDGRTPYDFITPYVPHYAHWSENLAEGYPDAQGTTQGWMHSQKHREALLDARYDNVGYAVCSSPSHQNMVVQHFVDL